MLKYLKRVQQWLLPHTRNGASGGFEDSVNWLLYGASNDANTQLQPIRICAKR